MYSEGIDVSVWQDDITAALAGKSLCIVKVSQRDFLDPDTTMHLNAARALSIPWLGGYHWLDPTPSAEDQAALFLRNAPKDLDFLVYDVEGRILRDMPQARDMTQRAIRWLHERDPRPVLQYSSRGTWPGNNGQDGNWVADYGGDPYRLAMRLTFQAVQWVIWQYTSTPLDSNRFKPDELARLCHETAPAPKETDPMTNLVPTTCHRVVDIPAGKVLYRTPGGSRFTRLSSSITFGLLGGAGPDYYHVADGDNGVYVKRSDVMAVRSADKNVGA